MMFSVFGKPISAFPQLRGAWSIRIRQDARLERSLQPAYLLRESLRKIRQSAESHWSSYVNRH